MKSPFRSAFTLLEMMIAIAIFGLVLLSIYTSWSGILRSSKTGSKAAENSQRARIAIKTIEDALTTSQLFVQNGRLYAFLADTETDPDFLSLSFVSRLPANFPGNAIFGDLAVRRVSFNVEPGTNSPSELILRQAPVMMGASEAGQEYAISLARDVSLFRMEFLDEQLGEWVPEWLNTNQIPRMVRVALGVGQNEKKQIPVNLLTRVVSVPSSPVLPEYQLPQLMGVPRGVRRMESPSQRGADGQYEGVSQDQLNVPGQQ